MSTSFDPNLLRIILAAAGVVIVLAILLWGMRHRPGRSSGHIGDDLPPGALDDLGGLRRESGEPDDELMWQEAEALELELAAQRNPDSVAEGIIGPVRVIARREQGATDYTAIEPEVRGNQPQRRPRIYRPQREEPPTVQPAERPSATAGRGGAGSAAPRSEAKRRSAIVSSQPASRVATNSGIVDHRPAPRSQPPASDDHPPVTAEEPVIDHAPRAEAPAANPTTITTTDATGHDSVDERRAGRFEPVAEEIPSPPPAAEPPPKPAVRRQPAPAPAPAAPAPAPAAPAPSASSQRPQSRHEQLGMDEKIIAIHITAPQELLFTGHGIIRATAEAGLEYGDLEIYHRTDPRVSSPLFSLANMVKPGHFPAGQMEEFTTPGITLFMRLPNPLGGLAAFDQMYAAAQKIAAVLHGELRDTSRSMMSRQTAEHIRDGIIEFELKLRTRRANNGR